jgi:hypothetical protein
MYMFANYRRGVRVFVYDSNGNKQLGTVVSDGKNDLFLVELDTVARALPFIRCELHAAYDRGFWA